MADKVIDVDIKVNNAGIKSLRQELRETTIALQQATDPALIERLQQKAGQLKDTMADVNATIEATAGSATENLAKGLGKATSVGISGFQGLISAQALFGNESEQVTQTLVKLQALAGLSDALNSLGALGDTMTEIKASFVAAAAKLGLFTTAKEVDTGVTIGQTVATEGATVATSTLGATMNALPIFAIIAGLTAVVGAIAYFASQTEEAVITQEDFNQVATETGKSLGDAKKNVNEVGLAFENAGKGVGSKKKALELFNEKFGQTLGIAKNYEQAEAAFVKNADVYIQVSALRAKADAFRALSAQASADAFVKAQETELSTMQAAEYLKTMVLKGKKTAVAELKQIIINNALEAQKESDKRIKALDAEANRVATEAAELESTLVTIKQESEVKKKEIDKVSASEKKKNLEQLKAIQDKENADYINGEDEKFRVLNEIEKTESERKIIALQQALDRQIEILGDDDGAIKLATKTTQNAITKIIDDAEADRLAKQKVIDDAKITKAEADKLRFIELTGTESEYKIAQLQSQYAKENALYAGNAEIQKALKIKLDADISKIDKETKAKEKENVQALQNAKLQMASDAIGGITDLISSASKSDEKSQKRAFEINKTGSIAQAIIQTYLAANSALASPANNLFPGQAQIAAGIAIIGGLANVAKIRKQTFGGGASSGGGGSSASASSATPQANATPQFNMFGSAGNANNLNASGQPNNGQNITVTAVVSETDMTYNQGRVNAMKLSASL